MIDALSWFEAQVGRDALERTLVTFTDQFPPQEVYTKKLSPAQWLEAIGLLARDPQLRRRMGRAGRQRVESEFSVASGAARWLTLLDGIQRRRHAA